MAAIGRVLLMDKGAYSGSTIYNQLDWVRDNGASWVCKVDGTVGIAPPTLPTTSNANWTLMAADGTVSGSIDWSNVNNKPFDTVGNGLNVNASNEIELDISMLTASNISYDNSGSGAVSIDVQAAIDELFAGGGGGGSTTLAGLTDVTLTSPSDGQMLVYDDTTTPATPFWKNVNQPTIPTVNSASLYITQNGVDAYGTGQSFNANSSSSATANIVTDDWVATASVSSGTVSFSGIDDSGNYGYEVFFNITSSSVNLNPTAQLSSISGEGTSSMSVTYTTDADNNATCKLRRIK